MLAGALDTPRFMAAIKAGVTPALTVMTLSVPFLIALLIFPFYTGSVDAAVGFVQEAD